MRREFRRGLGRVVPPVVGTLRELSRALRDGKITDAEREALESQIEELRDARRGMFERSG